MIQITKVNFGFKLIEIFNEQDAVILILLGRLRITIWKDWKTHGN